jgi:hypothetical protein
MSAATPSSSNVLFCHIPKCGGTNINAYLQKHAHNYTWYIHRILKYDIQQYTEHYKFAIIRDPIDKLVSLYFYQTNVISHLGKTLKHYQNGNWNNVANLYQKYNINSIGDFLDKYAVLYNSEIKPHICNLRHIANTQNMHIWHLVGFLPQHLFICDDNFNILVNDVVDIKHCNTFVLEKFGVAMSNRRKLNVHPHSNDDYRSYLTEKHVEDIREIYKEDYKYLFSAPGDNFYRPT